MNETYDIRLLQGFGATGALQIGLVDGDGRSSVVSGVEKTVQAFLVRLLTIVGSVRARPAYGTTFLIDAMAGLWRTPGDVAASFAGAELDIREQLATLETTLTPADERLASASLRRVEFLDTGIVLEIEIVTLAGTDRVFRAPLPYIPR